MSKIKTVGSLNELASVVADGGISVVDCFATWCGPCKAIAPTFERLSNAHSPPVRFLKVDVDKSPDVAAKYGVRAMPTFLCLRGMNKVDEMRGADPAGLERFILKYKSSASAAAAAGGGGASGSGTTAQEKGLEGYASLVDSIDQSQIACLNESSEHTIRDLLRSPSGYLESDADEQLLLTVPMNQSTKIRALRFTTDPAHAAHAPKTLRLFVNQPTIGFDDAESLEPAQEVELTADQAAGKEAVQLRFVRFQTVNALSIFVKSNQGDEDVTRIDRLDVLGLATEGTDMTKLKAQSADE